MAGGKNSPFSGVTDDSTRSTFGAISNMKIDEIVTSGPVFDLICAINCFVTTGDHFGWATVVEYDDCIVVIIPYDPLHPIDAREFQGFRARLRKIAVSHVLCLGPTTPGRFVNYEFWVPKNAVVDLTKALLRAAARFGSPRGLVFEKAALQVDAGLQPGDVKNVCGCWRLGRWRSYDFQLHRDLARNI